MPDPTAIRLASEARRADLADELYSSVVEMHNLIDKAYQDERAAHRATLEQLARAGADPGGATDACRFLGCSAADLLATVTSLYETRGGLVAEVADLRAKLVAAESEAHRVAVAAAEVTAERDDLRRLADIAKASRADQAMMHARAQAALEEARARVAALEARPVTPTFAIGDVVMAIKTNVMCSIVEIRDDGEPIYVLRTYPGGINFGWTRADDLRLLSMAETVASPVTLPTPGRGAFDFAAFADDKTAWSVATFGPGPRTAGVIDHIRKELAEIEAKPDDVSEWVDVIILAMDGAYRSAGANGQKLVEALVAKMAKNKARAWPNWRTRSEHEAIEHDRSGEPTTSPRYVAVKRDEVNGRPASWFHTEAEAERYVALCNDNPDLFGADDEIEGALESYTHAVVDTRPEGP